MIRSVLDNQHFDTIADFRLWVTYVYENSWRLSEIGERPENYRRLRMITRQYVEHRRRLHALTTLTDVERWLNHEHLALFNVPMNHLDLQRKPTAPHEFKFYNVVRDSLIDTIHRLDSFTEEPVKGEGWSGNLMVKIKPNPRHDITALKFALGSYGIYITETLYAPIQDTWAGLDFSFVMLRRDFKFKDFREEDWLNPDMVDDDDDRFDHMSLEELEQLDRDELFDDDAQWKNMGFEHDFE